MERCRAIALHLQCLALEVLRVRKALQPMPTMTRRPAEFKPSEYEDAPFGYVKNGKVLCNTDGQC